MKKFRIIETFMTAVITEIEIPIDELIDDFIDREQQLINAHMKQVVNWSDKGYAQEIANNADNSEFEIEEIIE